MGINPIEEISFLNKPKHSSPTHLRNTPGSRIRSVMRDFLFGKSTDAPVSMTHEPGYTQHPMHFIIRRAACLPDAGGFPSG